MAMNTPPQTLPMTRVADIEVETPAKRWLIEPIWGRADVGIIGGSPKSCKSWLGLDMAVSVASGTPLLDHFPVSHPGPTLIYMAEDALPMVRMRVESLCRHRHIDIQLLDLHVITCPALRLDLDKDQRRLANTLEHIRPHLLLLDPLIRLHRLDENSSSDVSRLLGYLREMQRAFDTAVVLVHHASKKHRAQPGQALRGSSDLHAFGDANAYLARRREHLVLTLEQRAARPPEPMTLQLLSGSDADDTHLAITSALPQPSESLSDRVRDTLQRAEEPMTRTAIRAALRVNNQRLGQVLQDLEDAGAALRTQQGWLAPDQQSLPLG